jgi:hypothetical protein
VVAVPGAERGEGGQQAGASKRGQGAGVHEVTQFRLNDAGPLIRLGRLAEAGRLLAECQRVFEDHADTADLGVALTVRADLEYHRGQPDESAIEAALSEILAAAATAPPPDPEDA